MEADATITLKEIVRRLNATFNIVLCTSALGNYLEGKHITYKKFHLQPIGMNTGVNKEKRRVYIQQLQLLVAQGKEILL